MIDEDHTREVIEARERRLYDGLTASSPNLLGDVMSEDILYVHSGGLSESKQGNIIGQQSGLYKHGPIARQNGYTKVCGAMAVTTGHLDMVDLAYGQPYTLHLEQTLIWFKEEDGVWRCVLRLATPAMAECEPESTMSGAGHLGTR